MRNERLYQEYLYNKYKDKSFIQKENKLQLMEECNNFQINYTNVYVKIINYQILTYGVQLSGNDFHQITRQDIRETSQKAWKRKNYHKNNEFLKRKQNDNHKLI